MLQIFVPPIMIRALLRCVLLLVAFYFLQRR